jgi:hypothetical protein
MSVRAALLLFTLIALGAAPAAAQEGPASAPRTLDDAALEGARGGLQTPSGLEIGLGASVRTYVDGSLALETRLTWTTEGAVSERVFDRAADGRDPGVGRDVRAPVTIAPGTVVTHDLSENRIASVLLNTGSDRSIRQETDVTLHLPQLPDLQQRIATERLGQALQALAPEASGLNR